MTTARGEVWKNKTKKVWPREKNVRGKNSYEDGVRGGGKKTKRYLEEDKMN